MKVLLVDDDRDLVDILSFTLTRAQMTPIGISDPLQALGAYEAERPDIVVLDINMAGRSGLDLLTELRKRGETPVIMLTARDAEEDKLRGFELGADDYVTKPFSHHELIARIRAQLRRSVPVTGSGPAPDPLVAGPIRMDVARHGVTKDGQPVALTVTEFRLLHRLLVDADTVVPTDVLVRHVWGHSSGGSDVLRVTVHRLRRKLEDDASEPRLLFTVAGVGVMLKHEAATGAS